MKWLNSATRFFSINFISLGLVMGYFGRFLGLTPKQSSWVSYDWANSAFATTIIAGFFPVFFRLFHNADVSSEVATFRLGVTNSVAAISIALLAPFIGAAADRRSALSRWLFFCASVGCLATASLAIWSQGQWFFAALSYGLALAAFSASLIFYDALLPVVSDGKERHRTSLIGFAAGYLGGGLVLLLSILAYQYPEFVGLDAESDVVRGSFFLVAAWWLVFSLPVLRLNSSKVRQDLVSFSETLKGVILDVRSALIEVKRNKVLLHFLIAYLIYMDGVNTVIKMAVNYGVSLGIGAADLLGALLLTQFVGVPSAMVFERLQRRIGAKRAIVIGLSIYLFASVLASAISEARDFYILAATVGLVQGGVQALSRSYYSMLVPQGDEGKFFGLYNLVGKVGGIFGPLLVGIVTALTESNRLGISVVAVLFLVGGVIVLRLPEKRT